jgi:hypothetical protein
LLKENTPDIFYFTHTYFQTNLSIVATNSLFQFKEINCTKTIKKSVFVWEIRVLSKKELMTKLMRLKKNKFKRFIVFEQSKFEMNFKVESYWRIFISTVYHKFGQLYIQSNLYRYILLHTYIFPDKFINSGHQFSVISCIYTWSWYRYTWTYIKSLLEMFVFVVYKFMFSRINKDNVFKDYNCLSYHFN